MTNIIGGLIVIIVAGWLGFGKSERVVIVHGGSASRKWKWVITISWFIIIVGYCIFIQNFSNGGWQNPWVGLGFCLAFLGFILLGVGKFFHWLNHN